MKSDTLHGLSKGEGVFWRIENSGAGTDQVNKHDHLPLSRPWAAAARPLQYRSSWKHTPQEQQRKKEEEFI